MPRPLAAADLVASARAGSPRALARLISAIEAAHPGLPEVFAALPPGPGAAHVVGITGAPGAGKSTTTSALIGAWRARGLRVAVLAVDPSSPFTGGALLGDRIRMDAHAADPGVFIRSMAARGHLGGLAAATPQAIRLLAALAYDVILIETVGVGQSEIEIAGAADTTVVLMVPGMGDGIQASKAGILEIADIFAVNKSDLPGAHRTVREIRQALNLTARADDAGARPAIVAISALDGTGIADLVEAIDAHRERAAGTGELAARRARRARAEIEALVLRALGERLAPQITTSAAEVSAGRVDPQTAAHAIAEAILARRP